MIALATMCAVSVLFRTVGQPFEVFESAAARLRESATAFRGRSSSSYSDGSDAGGGGRNQHPSSSSSSLLNFDATISECLQQIILTGKDQVKAGLPLFDVPPFDPVTVGPVFITDNSDFFFRLRNVTIGGLVAGMNATNMRIEYNTADRRIYLLFAAPWLTLGSPYDVEIRMGRLLPAFFEPGYAVRSAGQLNAILFEVDVKAFVEFKEEPAWGRRLVLDSTYLDFEFDQSSWSLESSLEKDNLVKYLRMVVNDKDALDPVIDVVRPIFARSLNKFLYETMRNVFKNVILI